jgi:hypothetical protein
MDPSTQQFFFSSSDVVYCKSLDDGRMTDTCCGSNIGREEDLLRWRTHSCFVNFVHSFYFDINIGK